jgi:predicted nucleotidyltransferase
MNEVIVNQIQSEIDGIVKNNDVTILLAIESGSRAWGFESQNSDYDVRFIYARTESSYLRISPIRDVIELPISGDLDINGWDLQKAISLMVKSNPPIMEWLSSPILYRQHPVAELLREVGQKFFDTTRTSHHYYSMALKNYKYLKDNLVLRKKYLYVLRPLLCIEWIELNKTMPPMLFDDLVSFSLNITPNDQLKGAIQNLLTNKKAGQETEKQPRDLILDSFIEQRLSLYASKDFGVSKLANYTLADSTFRTILKQLSND